MWSSATFINLSFSYSKYMQIAFLSLVLCLQLRTFSVLPGLAYHLLRFSPRKPSAFHRPRLSLWNLSLLTFLQATTMYIPFHLPSWCPCCWCPQTESHQTEITHLSSTALWDCLAYQLYLPNWATITNIQYVRHVILHYEVGSSTTVPLGGYHYSSYSSSSTTTTCCTDQWVVLNGNSTDIDGCNNLGMV